MSAKKNVHVPLRCDKIKTNMMGEKEEKRDKIKKRGWPFVGNRNYKVDFFTFIYHYCCSGN